MAFRIEIGFEARRYKLMMFINQKMRERMLHLDITWLGITPKNECLPAIAVPEGRGFSLVRFNPQSFSRANFFF